MLRGRVEGWAVLVMTAGLLSGCATNAEVAARNDNQELKNIIGAVKACTDPVYANAKYDPLRVHIPLGSINGGIDRATLTQLSSEDYATPDEIGLLSDYKQSIQPCRTELVNGLESISPSLAQPSVDLFSAEDQEAVLLAQHQITWGQFVSTIKNRSDDAQQFTLTSLENIRSQLAQEDAEERAQRAQAWANFSAAMQRQQMIDSMNQPVTTNCNTFMNQTTCQSY